VAGVQIPCNADDATKLTGSISGEEYMQVLLARQAAYVATHPHPRGWPPLLEWFVRAEDEPYVVLPAAMSAPKRNPKPRVYRSAESIRAELERVDTQLAAFGVNDVSDRAAANLSPHARSRAAARAGRRRFERMDRDLRRYTELTRRRDRLVSRLATAEAREKQPVAEPQGDRS
jgi:hypothetical protein